MPHPRPLQFRSRLAFRKLPWNAPRVQKAGKRERERASLSSPRFPSASSLSSFFPSAFRFRFARHVLLALRLSWPKSWRDRATPVSRLLFSRVASRSLRRGLYVRQRRAFHGNTCVQLLIFVFFRRVPARGTAHVRKYLRSVFLGRVARRGAGFARPRIAREQPGGGVPFSLLRECSRAYPRLSREYGNFGNPRDSADRGRARITGKSEMKRRATYIRANGPGSGRKKKKISASDDVG